MQKNEAGPLSNTYTKINSKCIIDLNARSKTVQLLGETLGTKLHDFGFGNDYLDVTPKAQVTQ